jgi:hypothetical protein
MIPGWQSSCLVMFSFLIVLFVRTNAILFTSLMFAIPRLAIVCGLIVFPSGPLNVDRDNSEFPELFRPFKVCSYSLCSLDVSAEPLVQTKQGRTFMMKILNASKTKLNSVKS